MKKLNTLLSVPIALLAFSLPSHARFETLISNQAGETNSIVIESYETVRVVSRRPRGLSGVYITKSGEAFQFDETGDFVFRGPAVVELRGGTSSFLTLEITPEAFDPAKTLVVPPGTNQVAVTLECSTNLVNWTAATNGIYGSPTEAKFFRIRAEQVR